MQGREKNRTAMKFLVHCTHFLTRLHSAHSINFTQLVDLVVSCGVRKLQVFIENASWNAVYTSQGAEADLIETLGTWVEESILKMLQKASVCSVMADECSVITAVEELSVFCHWEEDGTPVECFLDIVSLKADAESTYLALVKCIKDKKSSVGNIVGMCFDGAAKASYTALVVSLESSYQNSHTSEALGLYKALSKFTTIAAIYL